MELQTHEHPLAAAGQFGRWAAAMSRAAIGRRSDPDADEAAAPDDWIAMMADHRARMLRQYYAARHYWRQRQRLARAARRRSRRRGRPVTPAWQHPGFARWCPGDKAWGILNATRPDPSWRRCPDPAAPPMAERLRADWDALDHALEGAGLEPSWLSSRGELCWHLRLDDYEGHDLGLFEVRLAPDGAVRARGGDCQRDGYSHPHVGRDGRLCTGRFEGLRPWLYLDGALELVFLTINQILRTYNPESPYIRLEELVHAGEVADCSRCGRQLAEDEGTLIGDDLYCDHCCTWCEGCSAYVDADTPGEVYREAWYCESCAEALLERCEACGRNFLARDGCRGADGEAWCPECAAPCDGCGEEVLRIQLQLAPDSRGLPRWLCRDCREDSLEERDSSASTLTTA